MDQAKLVELLNEDLELEYRSIVQYVQHIASVKGAQYQSTLDELATHVRQELDHAITLARQIDFLEGVPSTRVPDVPRALDARAPRCRPTSISKPPSCSGTASAPNKRTKRRFPMSRRPWPRSSSKPRSTRAICEPHSADPRYRDAMAEFTGTVSTHEALRALYREPSALVQAKKVARLDDTRRVHRGAPRAVSSRRRAAGRCDVSPRGGPPGFVRTLDEQRLAIPDLSGNNLLDSLTNVVANSHAGLLFVIPGRDETLRVEARPA